MPKCVVISMVRNEIEPSRPFEKGSTGGPAAVKCPSRPLVTARAFDISDRIFGVLSDEPMTFNNMCRRAKLHPRTAKSYLSLIRAVQAKEKIEMELNGFRIMITKRKVEAEHR